MILSRLSLNTLWACLFFVDNALESVIPEKKKGLGKER